MTDEQETNDENLSEIDMLLEKLHHATFAWALGRSSDLGAEFERMNEARNGIRKVVADLRAEVAALNAQIGGEMTAQLQGRELDAALARALGQEINSVQYDDDYWRKAGGESITENVVAWERVPRYHDDLNAMRDVEDELIKRDKYHEYIDALDGIVLGGWYTRHPEHEMTHATAEQKARAALAVLMEAK